MPGIAVGASQTVGGGGAPAASMSFPTSGMIRIFFAPPTCRKCYFGFFARETSRLVSSVLTIGGRLPGQCLCLPFQCGSVLSARVTGIVWVAFQRKYRMVGEKNRIAMRVDNKVVPQWKGDSIEKKELQQICIFQRKENQEKKRTQFKATISLHYFGPTARTALARSHCSAQLVKIFVF